MLKKYWYFIFLVLFGLCLGACMSEALPVTEPTSEQIVTNTEVATFMPTLTNTPKPTLDRPLPFTLTPSPTPIPTLLTPSIDPSPITPSATPSLNLPDVIINTGIHSFPLFTCLEPQELGQIWLSRFPYNEADRLFADSDYAFYEPHWSPDGEHIALVAINPTNTSTETQINGSWQYYTDQILMADGNGTQYNPLNVEFTRSEFFSFENSTCTVTNGITSIVGWSPDSNWLAFTVLENNEALLYVTNVHMGRLYLVAENVQDASWHPYDNSLLVITLEPVKINIVSIDDNGVNEILDLIPNFLPNHIPSHAQFTNDGNNLFMDVSDNSFYYAPYSLWEMDLLTAEVEQISEVNFEKRHVLQFFISGQTLIFCSYQDGRYFLELAQLATWSMSTLSEVHQCSMSLVPNSNNQTIVGVLSTPRTIDIMLVNDLNLFFLQNIGADFLHLPELFKILSFSWMR